MEVEIDKINFDSTSSDYKDFSIIDTNVTYSDFFERFLIKNQACLIKDVARNWQASQLWLENDSPNFCYLDKRYGNSLVSVINCEQHHQENPMKWKFKDYLQYWMNRRFNYSDEMPTLYLKDWHLKNEFPNDDFYKVPLYFASDWLNEYLVENSLDDYRFVYMGTNRTWSPFHVDVMTSYSWSTNICGQKRWVLFPPGEENNFYDCFGNLPNDISDLKHTRKHFEIIQNPGDAIFVPSNWHHQVWNIQDTISINHNWVNGCNLHYVWLSMKKNLADVKNEIRDCQDMENFLDHCQVMLKASFGFNFKGFFDLILYIANKRLLYINDDVEISLFNSYLLRKNHALFDLNSIKSALKDLMDHEDMQQISCFKNLEQSCESLLREIETCLK